MPKLSLRARRPLISQSTVRSAVRGFLATAALTGALVGQTALAAGDATVTYTVQPGDTLSQIAARHGVATGDLSAANHLLSLDALQVGQALVVPSSADLARQAVSVRESRKIAPMTRPTAGPVTTYFKEPGALWRLGFHPGVDFGDAMGTPIVAAASGTVVEAGWDAKGGYGQYVTIDHGDGVLTLYAHMSLILASPGERVAPGSMIGEVGSTGFSTGPHLHWEVRVDGQIQDPLTFLG
jgi:murein DD-endopeptidase MepM/ murein hydrolase activator NlpD